VNGYLKQKQQPPGEGQTVLNAIEMISKKIILARNAGIDYARLWAGTGLGSEAFDELLDAVFVGPGVARAVGTGQGRRFFYCGVLD